MDVVLAVDEKGNILSKPSKIPEGKMDINIKETCDYDHTNSPPPFEDNLPIDNGGWGGNNGNSPGTNTPGDTNYDDGIPDENTWQNNNFGIN